MLMSCASPTILRRAHGSRAPLADAPSGAYPAPVVDDSGNRFEAKSNDEATENERPWRPRRPLAAGLALSNGSSCSSDAFLDEDMLGLESVSAVSAPGLELASEASSSESRAPGCEYNGGIRMGDLVLGEAGDRDQQLGLWG